MIPVPAAERGFTLIELLVVIGILALLIVAFAPDLVQAGKQGEIQDTKARLLTLKTGIDAFERRTGTYPPDDFEDPEGKLQFKADNGINTGIESMVVFIAQKRGGIELSENEGRLANTDGDDNGVLIPRLDRSTRVEVVDAWGTPLAYFAAYTGGMDRSQRIQLPEQYGGDVVPAKAWKNSQTGAYLGGRKYQIVSAGPDGIFNTEDDLTYPERPRN